MFLPKRQEITSACEDVEKMEPLCTVSRSINWCSHYGQQYSSSSKNIHTFIHLYTHTQWILYTYTHTHVYKHTHTTESYTIIKKEENLAICSNLDELRALCKVN